MIPTVAAATTTKTKQQQVSKWDCRNSNFLQRKGNKFIHCSIQQNERHPTEWKDLFANHLSDKG